MLESVPVTIIVSAAAGFLAGIGVGGGSLLMLWLTLAVGMQYAQSRIINLLFFLPSALIACIFRHKQGALHIKKVIPAMLGGCVAAGIFSYIGRVTDVHMLKKLFGLLLLATGIREIFYKSPKA